MKRYTLTALLAVVLCLLVLVSGCAGNTTCDEDKLQSYHIDDMTMFVGDTTSLPLGGADVTLSQNGIVAIENGTIRALSAGTVTITTRMECMESTFDITVEDNSRAVTVANGSHGTITGIETGSYPAGTKLDVTITAEAFNYIPTLKVNDEVIQLGVQSPVYTASITIEDDTNVEVTYFDYTLRGQSDIIAARQDLVVAESDKMVTTLFMYDRDLSFVSAIDETDHYSLTAGQLYRGMPYTSGNLSLNSYLQNVKYVENGVNHMDTDAYFGPHWGFLLGASCTDVVYWSMCQISDTLDFGFAQQMVERYGAYKVGDYTYTTQMSEDGIELLVNTKQDVIDNGEEVMFNAYALLQPGDACAYWFPDDPDTDEVEQGNHSIVVAEVHVVTNDDGSINGNSSYIRFNDLNGNYQNVVQVEVGGELVDAISPCVYREDDAGRLMFSQMYTRGYLPMTCKELLSPEEPVCETELYDSKAGELNFQNLCEGTIKCNYYMSFLEMEITDSEGNTVQKARRFTNEGDRRDPDITHSTFFMSYFMERHNFSWSPETNEDYALYRESDMIKPHELASGNYHCTLTVYVSNGDVFELRDFDFTV